MDDIRISELSEMPPVSMSPKSDWQRAGITIGMMLWTLLILVSEPF
jgi:hypothetical protein